jgi:diguanylate cyclase (GGDEF)-like protein
LSETRRTVDRLLARLHEPFEIDKGVKVHVGASIGIALYPDHGRTFADLMASADDAMYQAKSRGRSAYVMFG